VKQEIAEAAARAWGLAETPVLVAERENTVYRVGDYALRLHRDGYRRLPQLQSELVWMATLARGGLDLPAPLPGPEGALIAPVKGRMVSVLRWMPGAPAGTGPELTVPDPVAFAEALGRMMARLHDLSDGFTPPPDFTRPNWRAEGLLGPDPLWGRFWDNPIWTDAQRDVVLAARAAAKAQLNQLAPTLDQGLIHADLIPDNVLVDGDRVIPIDFDDGAWGYRDFELATFLLRQRARPDYPQIRAALIKGYSTRRAVDAGVLDLMILCRALTYPGWIMTRMDTPGAEAKAGRMTDTALNLAQTYLTTLEGARP